MHLSKFWHLVFSKSLSSKSTNDGDKSYVFVLVDCYSIITSLGCRSYVYPIFGMGKAPELQQWMHCFSWDKKFYSFRQDCRLWPKYLKYMQSYNQLTKNHMVKVKEDLDIVCRSLLCMWTQTSAIIKEAIGNWQSFTRSWELDNMNVHCWYLSLMRCSQKCW